MPDQNREVAPGPDERHVRTVSGQVLEVPAGWVLLPPGDAGLTRRLKLGGPTWTVKEKQGRRMFSRGVWAPAERVAAVRAAISEERTNPAYEKRLEAGRKRRAEKQVVYEREFETAVYRFLGFAPEYDELAQTMAIAIAQHATPVGSGTVARTERIPVERRAEAATIAWLRHQTTGYDGMRIARIKGKRREVRRLLAEQSRKLLSRYRAGESVPADQCPLRLALSARGSV